MATEPLRVSVCDVWEERGTKVNTSWHEAIHNLRIEAWCTMTYDMRDTEEIVSAQGTYAWSSWSPSVSSTNSGKVCEKLFLNNPNSVVCLRQSKEQMLMKISRFCYCDCEVYQWLNLGFVFQFSCLVQIYFMHYGCMLFQYISRSNHLIRLINHSATKSKQDEIWSPSFRVRILSSHYTYKCVYRWYTEQSLAQY